MEKDSYRGPSCPYPTLARGVRLSLWCATWRNKHSNVSHWLGHLDCAGCFAEHIIHIPILYMNGNWKFRDVR